MDELSIIFNETQYTLKNDGDIFFWNHLIDVLEAKNCSLDSDAFIDVIFDEYFKLTGEPLTIFSRGKIMNKNSFIDAKFWIDNFVHSVDLMD